MKETDKRFWDVSVALTGPVLTLAGILIGVWQFNVGEARKAEYEQASKLWLQRLDTYASVSKLAGKMASAPDDKSFKDAYAAFMAAYWGDMILVEDKEVEKAMVAFRTDAEDFVQGRIGQNHLKQRADLLLKTLKTSVSAGAPKQ